ncbi:hypothetical protein ARMGADRAFT_1167950 [Armillaria gallica]|uniref:Uncharacterized protein n=1 Tax=Armillaria gallica TaxID=47427 RepID=A0A2H3DAM8_ARMGA|nr:hypothetical protein ARMGADRAFT_1167950 [Armillaria gallica]
MYRFFSVRICKTAPRYNMLPVPASYLVEWLTGPQIVGYLLYWGLFGTLSMQLYLYYLAFPKDRRSIKYLVYGIYIVEFAQTILVSHEAFAMFGYGFGDLDALTEVHFNWLIVPIMTAVTASVGQSFYAYRIYILSRSRIVSAFVICASLTSFVAAMITGVLTQASGIKDRETSISLGVISQLDNPVFVVPVHS